MIWMTIAHMAFADTIDSVLVFTDRAEVTRKSTGQCINGSSTITFANLPYTTDIKTLRADTKGSSKVIGVRHTTKVLKENSNERVSSLLKEKDALLLKQRQENDAYALSNKEFQTIQAFEQQFLSSLHTELKANKDLRTKWTTGLDRFRTDKLRIQEEMHNTQLKLSDIQRDIALIDRQLGMLNVQPTQQSIDATVLLQCKGTSTVKTNLHYVVPSASWTPESDLFVEHRDGDMSVKLQVSAQIRQATGEDWNNAKITLSTAKPNLGAHALYPAPIWVNGAPNEEQRVMVQSMEDRSSLSNAGYSSQTATNVSIDDNGQSMQLTLPHRSNIASNGQVHWVPVDHIQADATISNISIPRATPYVFETVTFNNPTAYGLLGGSMHLYKNGVYVGDHTHPTVSAGEKMEISLGTLPHLKVERQTVQEKRDRKMLGKSQQLQRAYAISIQNNSADIESIEIREAIPLSKNEDIAVGLDREATTGTYTFDEYKGFVVWNMDLKAAQKERVELVYHIELPADWQVQ